MMPTLQCKYDQLLYTFSRRCVNDSQIQMEFHTQTSSLLLPLLFNYVKCKYKMLIG